VFVSQGELKENQEQGAQEKKNKQVAVGSLEEQGREQVIALPQDELRGMGNQEQSEQEKNKEIAAGGVRLRDYEREKS